MKPLSASELKAITGKSKPEDQYQVLTQLGCRPIFTDGQVRIYPEAVIRAMVAADNKGKKPELNI